MYATGVAGEYSHSYSSQMGMAKSAAKRLLFTGAMNQGGTDDSQKPN